MTESLCFQTRARTIDHLGREQIADCPTAISELWKNAYDAYARLASLQIYDGDQVVAAIYDDGHGMSRAEFINKWLVIGTESKLVWSMTPVNDRNGLSYRTRQGKKGIGRLSAAYLGNLLLLVTKRQEEDYVAALIDWRIFENPFLLLDDVRIPLVTFAQHDDLFRELPNLYDTLMGNVWGDSTDIDRTERIVRAWASYDNEEQQSGRVISGSMQTSRERIEQTLIKDVYTLRHLENWEVWSGASAHGTALLIAGVIPDIEAQLHPNPNSATDRTSREAFRSTLWSFVDPFRELSRNAHETTIEDFETSIIGWTGEQRKSIIEHAAGFEEHSASNLEHIIDGRVEEDGKFRGRVKAFGKWLEDVEIAYEEAMPTRIDAKVGAFDFYVGTMEFEKANTTLSDEEFSHLSELLEQFSGLMVFRDGFRVMPYGRPDSDYFGVEERRSKNAGREFWNHRRMLGRIAISSEYNPNLKDKAGREGIIDNRASKVFRAVVINILTTSARHYFGSASEIRKETLPELREAYDIKVKERERERMLKQKRRQFRTRLEESYPLLQQLTAKVDNFRQTIDRSSKAEDENTSVILQQKLSALKREQSALRLGIPPKNLSNRLRNNHAEYRKLLCDMDKALGVAEKDVHRVLERISPKNSTELLQGEVANQTNHVRRRLSRWVDQIEKLLDSEKERITAYAKGRIDALRDELSPVVNSVGPRTMELRKALSIIGDTAERRDYENQMQMESIIAALESLTENINLDLLAGDSSEEISGLRSELDRLTALAQLGITVEIIDHELAGFNSTIADGLKHFSAEMRNLPRFKQVQAAYEGLSNRLAFLSPLKLSGEPDYRHISGKEIERYLLDFFAKEINSKSFSIVATDEFKTFSVYEQRARIYPVFINLVNNARYWLHQRESNERLVMLSVCEEKVLVSDSGPGIDKQDIPDLFRLFFTRRQGGRGIGLYLCRSNLAAGGHKISYATEDRFRPLQGATFIIEFRDATFPQ